MQAERHLKSKRRMIRRRSRQSLEEKLQLSGVQFNWIFLDDQRSESFKGTLDLNKTETSSFYGPFLPTDDEVWPLPSSPLNISISQHRGNGVIKMGATGTPRWAIVPYAFHLRHRNPRQAHGHNSPWLGVSIATLEAGWGVGPKNRNMGVFFAFLARFF